jgi:hypothetical protein
MGLQFDYVSIGYYPSTIGWRVTLRGSAEDGGVQYIPFDTAIREDDLVGIFSIVAFWSYHFE